MDGKKISDGQDFQELFLLYVQAAEEYSKFLEDAVGALEFIKKKRAQLKMVRQKIDENKRARVGRLTYRIDNLHETTLKKYTGLTRGQFQKIESCFRRRHPGENNRVKLFMLLHWLATGSSFDSVASTFDSTAPEVSAAIFKLLNDFIAVLPDAVKLPDRTDLLEIGKGFTKLCGHEIFSNAAGVLGSYHFPIKTVDEDYPDILYVSKNSCYSIQLQIVTDHVGKILNIFIGKPGSIHKQNVLKESSLYQSSQNRYPPPGHFLLADHEYKCIMKPIAVITPFKDSISLSSREVIFNGRYKKAQDVLNSAVRMLCKRWKILERDLEHSLAHNIKIITTCCVLYNILGEPVVIDNSTDFNFFVSDEPSLDEDSDENEASYFRDCLLNNL